MSSSSSVIFSRRRRRRDNNGRSGPDVVVVGRSSTRISSNKLFTVFVLSCMIMMLICYIPSCRGNDEVGEVGEDDNEDYRD